MVAFHVPWGETSSPLSVVIARARGERLWHSAQRWASRNAPLPASTLSATEALGTGAPTLASLAAGAVAASVATAQEMARASNPRASEVRFMARTT